MDPNVFPEPEKFKLESFLDQDGKVYGSDRIIPFSLGEFIKLYFEKLKWRLFSGRIGYVHLLVENHILFAFHLLFCPMHTTRIQWKEIK